MRWTLFLILASLLAGDITGQRTVGIMHNDSTAFNGYTLFAPTSYRATYLIDNCGHVVNSWWSDFTPGQSAYLLQTGHLLRTARIASPFNSGGSGGRIEMYTWEGDPEWAYNYSSSDYHQHHDIEPLPNGNILVLSWDRRTRDEAIAAGRDPETVGPQGLWSEKIVEMTPLGTADAAIVWEWFLWDHLIQDFDSTQANYGDVGAHPELIDINFILTEATDWVHCNSIDYNPGLDQIMLSSRSFSEIWVIDHSTTTGEAATHNGGLAGKGGDILYRWGNPLAYRQGTTMDQQLFVQHDAHWIQEGRPGTGDIMIFNNGAGRPGGNYSSIDVISPPLNLHTYTKIPGIPYGPDSLTWTYDGQPDNGFFSQRISGAERMPNGNTLICDGVDGRFFEIDTQTRIVWDYVSPVSSGGPVSQGQTPFLNDIFRVTRYAPGYPAFQGRDMTPGGVIELDSEDSGCVIYPDSVTSGVTHMSFPEVLVYPNPAADLLQIACADVYIARVSLTSVTSLRLTVAEGTRNQITLNISDIPPGFYVVTVDLTDGRSCTQKLIIR